MKSRRELTSTGLEVYHLQTVEEWFASSGTRITKEHIAGLAPDLSGTYLSMKLKVPLIHEVYYKARIIHKLGNPVLATAC